MSNYVVLKPSVKVQEIIKTRGILECEIESIVINHNKVSIHIKNEPLSPENEAVLKEFIKEFLDDDMPVYINYAKESLSDYITHKFGRLIDKIEDISPMAGSILRNSKIELSHKINGRKIDVVIINIYGDFNRQVLLNINAPGLIKDKILNDTGVSVIVEIKSSAYPAAARPITPVRTVPIPKKDNNIILGGVITGELDPILKALSKEGRRAKTSGFVIDFEEKKLKGWYLYSFVLFDKEGEAFVKFFSKTKKSEMAALSKKPFIKIEGLVRYDKFLKEEVIEPKKINIEKTPVRKDTHKEKRIELHMHTKMSMFDSVCDIEELTAFLSANKYKRVALTDHGNVHLFPDFHRQCVKNNISPIFGMEGYLVDDTLPPCFNLKEDKPLKKTVFSVVSMETTGINVYFDKVNEVKITKVKNGKVLENKTYNYKNGMTPSDAEKIMKFIDGDTMVIYGGSWVIGFLRNNYFKKIENPVLDLKELVRSVYNLEDPKLNIKNITDVLKIKTNSEEFLYCSKCKAKVLLKMLEECGRRGIKTLKGINSLRVKKDFKEHSPYHIILLAKNYVGLKNLYKLVSKSHTKTFYRVPRILKSDLIKYKDGLILGTACEKGELYQKMIEGASEQEIKKLIKFYDYLEIQPLTNNEFLIQQGKVSNFDMLKEINKTIYKLGEKFKKPVCATCDAHFLNYEDSNYRYALQVARDWKNPSSPLLYFRTTDEMLKEFDYLNEVEEGAAEKAVLSNPKIVADFIEDLKPIPDGPLNTPKVKDAEKLLRKSVELKLKELYGDKIPAIVEERVKKEVNAIIKNKFADLYLIAQKLVEKSLSDGYIVGSRGSVGSSYAAYLLNITEVNSLPPHYRCGKCFYTDFNVDKIKYSVGADLPSADCPECGERLLRDGFDIPFETFCGFKGEKVPDIDLNFSGDYQPTVHRFVEDMFGKKNVVRAGTIMTVAKKTAFSYAKKYSEYLKEDFKRSRIARTVKYFEGIKTTTGQHPGGLIIIPEGRQAEEFTPVNLPANDREKPVTSHFDYHSLETQLLKLDILGHDGPTQIRLLKGYTGIDPMAAPLDDNDTLDLFLSCRKLGIKSRDIGMKTGVLGIPEFGTKFVRKMLEEAKPSSFADLVRISGLSHGTNVWVDNARDLIKNQRADLSKVISMRDDIMNYLINKGLAEKDAFEIMERVRKGKKLEEKHARIMRENKVPPWYIASCNKIEYLFPKAHAAAYVLIAFRIAYFKVHHKEAFYASFLTVNNNSLNASEMLKSVSDINERLKELDEIQDFSQKEKNLYTVLELVKELKLRGVQLKDVDMEKSHPSKIVIDDDKGLILPFIAVPGLGVKAALSIQEARKEKPFSTVENFAKRTKVNKTHMEYLKNTGFFKELPDKLANGLFKI